MNALSKRLNAIASLITPGSIVCDVGTDHGYLVIFLVRQNKCPSAIAMDLRPGPLCHAKEHIALYGLTERIQTRLSDGTAALLPGEADSIVCAGMGGELILHILSDGADVCRSAKELILQPQSQIDAVRRYLREHSYRIMGEDMVFEDGKYYTAMRVVPLQGESTGREEENTAPDDGIRALFDCYGEFLLKQKHPVLAQYLDFQEKLLCDILAGLPKDSDSQKIIDRTDEIKYKLAQNQRAQQMMSAGTPKGNSGVK